MIYIIKSIATGSGHMYDILLWTVNSSVPTDRMKLKFTIWEQWGCIEYLSTPDISRVDG